MQQGARQIPTGAASENRAARIEGLNAALAVLAAIAVLSLFFTGPFRQLHQARRPQKRH